MNSNNNLQDLIIADFEEFETWEEKYERLIEIALESQKMDAKDKIDTNKIQGCSSRAWLVSELRDGKLYFKADSDSLIVKGLTSLLTKIYSGLSPQEIVDLEPVFIDKIGFKKHLSANRASGLGAFLDEIKKISRSFV
jgi:cysteine desulfuration protein SufE